MKPNTHTSAQREIIAARRARVAHLRLRGLSQREILRALKQAGSINPETGECWSLYTINQDIRALERQWREEAARDIADHKARVLAELQEVRRLAWRDADMDKVLKALIQVRAMMGLDQPAKIAPTSPEGDREYHSTELTDDERLERLAELLERGGPGGGGSDSEDGGL